MKKLGTMYLNEVLLDKYHHLNEDLINEALILLGKNKEDNNFGNVVIFAGGAGCYPKDTEYFNGKEWVSISEYKKGDNVLVFNKITEHAYLDSDVEHVDLPLDNFYKISNKRIDFITSETHKHLFLNDKTNRFEDLKTKDLYNKNINNKRGNKGKLITSFNYVGGKGLELSENQIRLLISIIADGYIMTESTKKVRISLKKERKIERLKMLLNANEIEYKINFENGFTRFVFNFEHAEKEFSDKWYDCTIEQLKIVADEVLRWDGSITDRSESNRKENKSFSSCSKNSIDFVQFCFSALNYDVSKITMDYRGKNICYNITINDSYGVGISKNPRSKNTTDIIKLDSEENERMYCFTTNTGYFVVRQNGKIFVSGNSGKGWVQKNLLGTEGITLDVDAFKEMALKSEKIQAKILELTGVDISKLNLKNPKDVGTLHEVMSEKGLNLKDKKYNVVMKSILTADPRRKPNVIFDVTLKDMNAFKKLAQYAEMMGFSKDKIHLIWVANDVEMASKQNQERGRTVDDNLLRKIHRGVADTMAYIIKNSEEANKHFNGAFYIVFGQRGVDTKVLVNKNADGGSQGMNKSNHDGAYVASANYLKLKDAGKHGFDKAKIDKAVAQKLNEYTQSGSLFTIN